MARPPILTRPPVAILAATLAAYARVPGLGFVNLDDGVYVYENPHLRQGFSPANLKWLLLSFQPDNWFPATRLSLLLDYHLFGLRAGWYHAENAAIHLLAALLLYAFLRAATGVRWPSAFVALVFALHPAHVESVAWISERKDVLCAFFWFAALWAWVRYTARPAPGRYLGALALFALGLMSKPMIVTLPPLLILLDLWPLRRGFSRRLMGEKIPFVLLAGAASLITLVAQRSAGALQPVEIVPAILRIENALISVPIYLFKFFWPAALWIPYVYPDSLPPWQPAAAALGIAGVSVLVFRQRKVRPYLSVGWYWFLLTLAPVIGLVQAGPQARADRYLYVPSVGLAIILAWGAKDLAAAVPSTRRWLAAAGVVACAAMAILTWVQTGYWRDTDTLLRHAIALDSRNDRAWVWLASGLAGNPAAGDQAVEDYRTALRIRRDSADTHNLLGIQYFRMGRYQDAASEFREALRLYPDYREAHYDLGTALVRIGQPAQAIAEFEAALRVDSRYVRAHNELGVELWKAGRADEAISHLEQAVQIEPDFAPAQSNLGGMLMSRPGRLADAIVHLEAAQRIQPSPERQKTLDELLRGR